MAFFAGIWMGGLLGGASGGGIDTSRTRKVVHTVCYFYAPSAIFTTTTPTGTAVEFASVSAISGDEMGVLGSSDHI
jgi:hypothetical protein